MLQWWMQLVCIILVKFDGSRRRSGNAWITSYAATIHVDDVLLGLGGRTFVHHQVGGGSSAVAEYEGLLYGLERLAVIFKEERLDRYDDILVQGDCKTVMEQLQGRARPRKLDVHHQRAVQLLTDHQISACFQHIPRSQNVLADELAKCIADRYQTKCIRQTMDCLGEFANEKCTQIDTCLVELSKIDSPTQLALLRALARLCHQKQRHNDLLILADKIRDLLKYNEDSLFHVQDTVKLDAALEAHVYQSLAISEGKQLESFRRKTKHFVRTHSKQIERVQNNLDISTEWPAMKCALEAEIAASSKPNQWSDPVRLWLDGATDWVYC